MIPAALALRLAPWAACAALAMAALWWIDDRAYQAGRAACEADMQAEAARQREAVQRAQYGAAQRVAEIEARRAASEAAARRIADEAMDLGGDCLPAGIVQQLDGIGGRP